MNTDNPLPLGLQHDVNIHGYRMWVDKLGISRDDLNAAIESARNAINNNAEYKIVHANEPSASVDDKRRRHVINARSEEHTSELQSLMRISYAVFCLKKKK